MCDDIGSVYWMVDEQYFKELYENNIRENLMRHLEEKENDENYLPFGFMDDGLNENTYVPQNTDFNEDISWLY